LPLIEWITIRLVRFRMKGAVTTGKWNHREDEAVLRFARGDEAAHSAKTTLGSRVHAQSLGLNAEKYFGTEPKGRFFS
jgi:hypothetical protein